jgi:hypothetical protein
MQMYWSSLFTKRMVFNAAQALVKQADRPSPDKPSKKFSRLQPVYTLAIVNRGFPYKDEDRWLYTYKVADIENPRHVLEGLNFIVVDMEVKDMVRKIGLQRDWTMEKKRMAVLWMRFLQETGKDGAVDHELMEDDTIRMAVEICEEGAFTREEMEAYEAYWDHITLEVEIAEESEENKKQLQYKDKIIEAKDKALEDKAKVIEDNEKALEDKAKVIEAKAKVIEDKDKALEARDRLIEELKKQLSARSL